MSGVIEANFSSERPLPLLRAMPEAEAFPIEALGDVLAPAAEAIQDLVQSPWAMCSQAVLAAAVLAVQGFADIELPTGQIKPISSFFLTVAGSGERKSATDALALGPIPSCPGSKMRRPPGMERERKRAIRTKAISLPSRPGSIAWGPSPQFRLPRC
jgi:uncharacterized protein DUF3987